MGLTCALFIICYLSISLNISWRPHFSISVLRIQDWLTNWLIQNVLNGGINMIIKQDWLHGAWLFQIKFYIKNEQNIYIMYCGHIHWLACDINFGHGFQKLRTLIQEFSEMGIL